MRLWTGYFAYTNKYKNPVNISRFKPHFFNGPTIIEFAPSIVLLNWWKNIENYSIEDISHYIESYKKELDAIDVDKVLRKCKFFKEDEDATFLCYESSKDKKLGTIVGHNYDYANIDEKNIKNFCHRHVLAEYIRDNLKLSINEYVC